MVGDGRNVRKMHTGTEMLFEVPQFQPKGESAIEEGEGIKAAPASPSDTFFAIAAIAARPPRCELPQHGQKNLVKLAEMLFMHDSQKSAIKCW